MDWVARVVVAPRSVHLIAVHPEQCSLAPPPQDR
jgi:hypothetical protein